MIIPLLFTRSYSDGVTFHIPATRLTNALALQYAREKTPSTGSADLPPPVHDLPRCKLGPIHGTKTVWKVLGVAGGGERSAEAIIR